MAIRSGTVKVRSILSGMLLLCCLGGASSGQLLAATAATTNADAHKLDPLAPIRRESTGDIYQLVRGYPVEMDVFGRMVVGVHINGSGPFPFILDTGASRTVIYRSLTSLLDLPSQQKSRRIITVNGYVPALVYAIKDVYAFGRSLKLADTVALPDIIGSEVKGLLGVDILAGLTLEVRRKTALARLLPNADSLDRAGWSYIQGRPVAYGSLALEIDIGGVTVPLIVDTGASHTIINQAGADALLRSARNVVSKKGSSKNVGGTYSDQQIILPQFEVGGTSRKDFALYVADLPIFRLLGARRVPAIILGMDILGQQDIALDFAQWRLYMAKPTEK